MTKLDDLRDYLRSKNKPKDDAGRPKSAHTEKETFSLEVAGSDASSNPMASFGTEETDPDILDRLHMSPRHKPNMGEGASYLDQD